MEEKSRQFCIVYISPAGTTRHVAGVIESKLTTLGSRVSVFDLGRGEAEKARSAISGSEGLCLFIGSPVYACHAVPAVMQFMESLPTVGNGYSVPFVTWGAVTSGIALEEMASALQRKGLPPVAGASVVAQHSLMRQCEHPLGEGRPGSRDDSLIEELVSEASSRMRSEPPQTAALDVFRYQPDAARDQMRQLSLDAARQALPPKQLKKDRCTSCGLCAQECPVDAITCDPYPSFGRSCILCYTCVHVCPEQAIAADLSPMEEWLRKRSGDAGEQALTRVFSG